MTLAQPSLVRRMLLHTPRTQKFMTFRSGKLLLCGKTKKYIDRVLNHKQMLNNRPHKGGNFYPKVPTLSLYKRSDPSVMVEWGHGAKKMMLKPSAAKENIILSNFKLNLDESLNRSTAENHR